MPLGSSSEAPVIKPGPRTSRNLGPSCGLIAAGDRETSIFTAVSSWPANLKPCARGFVPGEQRKCCEAPRADPRHRNCANRRYEPSGLRKFHSEVGRRRKLRRGKNQGKDTRSYRLVTTDQYPVDSSGRNWATPALGRASSTAAEIRRAKIEKGWKPADDGGSPRSRKPRGRSRRSRSRASEALAPRPQPKPLPRTGEGISLLRALVPEALLAAGVGVVPA